VKSTQKRSTINGRHRLQVFEQKLIIFKLSHPKNNIKFQGTWLRLLFIRDQEPRVTSICDSDRVENGMNTAVPRAFYMDPWIGPQNGWEQESWDLTESELRGGLDGIETICDTY